MKKDILKRLPGIIISCLFFVALLLFTVVLIRTGLVPGKFLLLIGFVFLVLTGCIYLLTCNTKRIKTMLFGCALVVLVLVIMITGTHYLDRAVSTLGSISTVEVEIAEVGVYVRYDDPAQSTADLHGYRFGIMESLDRQNTDKALDLLASELSETLDVTTYSGITELADALLTDEDVDVVVFNSAYLDVLNDLEGYSDSVDQFRLLYTEKVETKVETAPAKKPGFSGLFNSETQKEDNSFAMYISGIDSRSGLISMSRSDVNILAVINPNTRQILLVSTPRDFYVPLPISDGIPDKLTHAGIYGVDVSIGTLEMLYDVDIDYFFRVNFSGFERIIDALGGITVNSPKSFTAIGGDYFYEGENFIYGEQALAFARERYAFADGDHQRGRNQMEVIKAVIRKAISPALLTNYAEIMDSVAGSFETSMPYEKIAELVRNQLSEGGDWNIVSYSVSGTGDTRVPYSLSTGAYVMIPDEETVATAKAKIAQVINGEILS